MSLIEEVPNIIFFLDELNDSRPHRFIVCEVGDYKNPEIKKNVICVRSIKDFSSHDVIFKWLRNDCLHNFEIKCLGGGNINLCRQTKTVKVSGGSINFGIEPNRIETIEMFKSILSDFVISER